MHIYFGFVLSEWKIFLLLWRYYSWLFLDPHCKKGQARLPAPLKREAQGGSKNTTSSDVNDTSTKPPSTTQAPPSTQPKTTPHEEKVGKYRETRGRR